MKHRYLGRSGLKVSEISYGNWITHGSQVEEDTAVACVNAALDVGITTFDTADVYAGTRAEAVLGRALKGLRREGLVPAVIYGKKFECSNLKVNAKAMRDLLAHSTGDVGLAEELAPRVAPDGGDKRAEHVPRLGALGRVRGAVQLLVEQAHGRIGIDDMLPGELGDPAAAAPRLRPDAGAPDTPAAVC